MGKNNFPGKKMLTLLKGPNGIGEKIFPRNWVPRALIKFPSVKGISTI